MKMKHRKSFGAAVSTLIIAMLACSFSPTALFSGTPTPTSTQTPLPTLTPTITPSPTATPVPIDIKVVSSLPMSGGSSEITETSANAINLRLKHSGYSACGGRYAITYEAWDDASPARGGWDPDFEMDNANKAAADPTIIAYLGTFNSGAARLSIPILNEAGPLVMISPANTYPGLTKPIEGAPDEPDKFYPTGVRNYTRVTTADDVQGEVAARFVKDQLNASTVFILDDGDPYGVTVANAFENTAQEIGLTVVGRQSINPAQSSYKTLMSTIAKSNGGNPPDAIFAGMVFNNNAAQVLKDKVAVLGDNSGVKFIGPDGIQTQFFIDEAGNNVAEGVYASVGGLPLDQLPEKGQQFIQDYEAEYGTLYSPYAPYGYEVMNVLLQAIENICATGGDPANRETVRAAVFAIRDFSGVLGTWSFNENGDTTLTDMTIYQVKRGAYTYLGVFQ